MTAPAPTEKGHPRTDLPPAQARGDGMRAHVGDEIVVRGAGPGVIAREGEVVGVHHPDGSPPFDVRWSDSSRVTLYFPGPDAYVRRLARTRTSDERGS
ncbi:DNA-binding protein [Streptomyces hygroscopicus]|uniref:DUF1918 domain-containing protein n=1 Tax=Streptomyces hygroscopicus TaxID=1912 RepID=UPI00224073F4|nr:DUF1918 domain-containing protein [Streptomyces hygroscopicus]MCW7942988.1 DNA-binding protein [Streptomyces hygroscopicus]